jgi:hypothetical protein
MAMYEQKALIYAEKYGIIEYRVKGSKMMYKEVFPTEGTYQVVVNLDTMKEEKRTNTR